MRWHADGTIRWTGTMTVAEALEASEAETEREDEVERSRLTMMRRYAEHTGCRRSFLLTCSGRTIPAPAETATTTSRHPAPRAPRSRSR